MPETTAKATHRPPIHLRRLVLLRFPCLPIDRRSTASPPAPPSSESPSSQPKSISDASVPEPASEISHSDINAGEEAKTTSSDGGMCAGKKVGIGLGVIIGVGLVGLEGFVYKRRRDNIHRLRRQERDALNRR